VPEKVERDPNTPNGHLSPEKHAEQQFRRVFSDLKKSLATRTPAEDSPAAAERASDPCRAHS